MKRLLLLFLLVALALPSFAQPGQSTRIRVVFSLPTTCDPTAGEIVFLVGTGLQQCVSTNTWSGTGGGGGGYYQRMQLNGADFPQKGKLNFSNEFSLTDNTNSTDVTINVIAANKITGLAAVATSGAYSDLTGKPTLAQTKTGITSQWLRAYDATTGLFTSTQPASSDLSDVNNIPVGDPSTANKTPVSTGAAWSFPIVPDCSNATTSKILFNGTTHQWNCGTDQSGGGSSGGAPNYSQAFTSQTSVTIAGTSHKMGSKSLVVQCYDTSAPAQAIIPDSWTVDGTSFDVVVSFATAQSGYCVVNGSGPPRYIGTFTAQTSVSVTAATHGLGTGPFRVTVFDNSTTPIQVEPDSVTVNGSGDVTIGFAVSQSGTYVIQ